MDLQNYSEIPLRLQCRILKEANGYGFGTNSVLAEAISTDEDQVNPNMLCMALTGYRTGPRAEEILKRLYDYLSKKPANTTVLK